MNDELYHFNQNHDKLGRFTFSRGGGGVSLKSKSSKQYNKDRTENKSKGLTDRQKEAIKIGAAVAGTALVAVGAYKLNQSGALDGIKDSILSRGKSEANNVLNKVEPNVVKPNVVKPNDNNLINKKPRNSIDYDSQFRKMISHPNEGLSRSFRKADDAFSAEFDKATKAYREGRISRSEMVRRINEIQEGKAALIRQYLRAQRRLY